MSESCRFLAASFAMLCIFYQRFSTSNRASWQVDLFEPEYQFCEDDALKSRL
jgi:hypothetical protein